MIGVWAASRKIPGSIGPVCGLGAAHLVKRPEHLLGERPLHGLLPRVTGQGGIMPEIVFGVDVAKDWIDVARSDGRVQRLKCAADGYVAFAQEAAQAGAFVVFEASGDCDLALRLALDASGVRYARVNPAQARFFAKGRGLRAKTDQVDARMLRQMGLTQDLAPTPPVPEYMRHLNALVTRRQQVVTLRKTERTRRHQTHDPLALGSVDAVLAMLGSEIARLEAAISACITADADLRAANAHLRSAPGVGPVTAAALLAQAPELGQISPKAIAALAGLAPVANDSGKRQGKRSIGGGRKPLRDILYMAAIGAARKDPQFRAFRDRLRAAGKAYKQATIAVARKLITTLNAMIREGRDYKPAAA